MGFTSVGAPQEDEIGLLDLLVGAGAAPGPEHRRQTDDAGCVSGPVAAVDVVRADRDARELLRHEVHLVRRLRAAEQAERVRAARRNRSAEARPRPDPAPPPRLRGEARRSRARAARSAGSIACASFHHLPPARRPAPISESQSRTSRRPGYARRDANRRNPARRRPVGEDGPCEGGAGLARRAACVARLARVLGRAVGERPGRRRAGAGARSCRRCPAVSRSSRIRPRATGRCAGWPPGWQPCRGGRRSRSPRPSTRRSSTPASSTPFSVRSAPPTTRSSRSRGGRRHPLAAAYRTALLPLVDDLWRTGSAGSACSSTACARGFWTRPACWPPAASATSIPT